MIMKYKGYIWRRTGFGCPRVFYVGFAVRHSYWSPSLKEAMTGVESTVDKRGYSYTLYRVNARVSRKYKDISRFKHRGGFKSKKAAPSLKDVVRALRYYRCSDCIDRSDEGAVWWFARLKFTQIGIWDA